ncbi:MAG TPA: hypothetical protein VFG64_11910 [Dongiaceae bacterium]|nr:hypothetical protein [Dongiaceae bacterium]
MKTISRIVLIAAGFALAPTLASADWQGNRHNAWLNGRDKHQEHRIEQGFRNGSLTPWEAKRLERRDHRIGHATHYARRDGHIDRREFHHLNNAYHHESRFIYRQKHDCGRR